MIIFLITEILFCKTSLKAVFMTIIDQLEQAITSQVSEDSSNMAHISLLEQFYAILVTRLASTEIYTELLRHHYNITETSPTIFAQLWSQLAQRQHMITELAVTHHIAQSEVESLIIAATDLGYQELKNLANGQFLPAFLQSKQAEVRAYLPAWASAVILPYALDNQKSLMTEDVIESTQTLTVVQPSVIVTKQQLIENETDASASNSDIELDSSLSIPMAAVMTDIDDAAHIIPSDHHVTSLPNHSRTNKAINWLIPVLLFIIALTALALLWFLVIQPKYMPAPTPAKVAPATVIVEEDNTTALLPAELTVGVDDNGGLYTCTAKVGDTTLQDALRQALSISFGEQISSCELIVDSTVTTDLGFNTDALSQVLSLVRAVPFARLQLQQNQLSLEAPDSEMLQRLVVDIRALLPSIIVNTITPVPMPDNGSTNFTDNIANDSTVFNNNDANNNFGTNNSSQDQTYQQSDDDTNDRVLPTLPRNNSSNNRNDFDNRNQTSGPISPLEADDLANQSIVSEQLRNARPVDRDIVSDN